MVGSEAACGADSGFKRAIGIIDRIKGLDSGCSVDRNACLDELAVFMRAQNELIGAIGALMVAQQKLLDLKVAVAPAPDVSQQQVTVPALLWPNLNAGDADICAKTLTPEDIQLARTLLAAHGFTIVDAHAPDAILKMAEHLSTIRPSIAIEIGLLKELNGSAL